MRRTCRFTRDAAEISREVEGVFVTNNGYSTGTNRELIQDSTSIQTWQASHWPDDHYFTLTIPLCLVRSNTKLSFVQAGVPEDQYEEIRQG